MCIGGIMMQKVLLFPLLSLSCSFLRAIQFNAEVSKNNEIITVTFIQDQLCHYPGFEKMQMFKLKKIHIKKIQNEPDKMTVVFIFSDDARGREMTLDVNFVGLYNFLGFDGRQRSLSFDSDDKDRGARVYGKIKKVAELYGFVFSDLASLESLPRQTQSTTWTSLLTNGFNKFKRNWKYLLGALGIGAMGYGFYHYYRQR
jgi:hypothetical protein